MKREQHHIWEKHSLLVEIMILWDHNHFQLQLWLKGWKTWKTIPSCKVRGKDWKGICCLVYSVFSAQKIAFLPNIVSISAWGLGHVVWAFCTTVFGLNHLSFSLTDCENPKGFLCHSSWNKTLSVLKINYWVFCCFIIYLCALGNLFLLEHRKQHLKRGSGERSAQLCFVMPFLHADQEGNVLSTGIYILDFLRTGYEMEGKENPVVQDGLLLLCKVDFLKFRLNEHCATLQGAVFYFLLRFPSGLMPMASAPSRGMAGTVAGSCHSPLILASHPQRDKCVQWSVLVTFCFWLVQVFL